jgi:cytochrome P450
VDYNPFSHALHAEPFPTYRWLRDEAPLYRNDDLDFWALSRFEDVWQAIGDWQTYSSARGTTPGSGPSEGGPSQTGILHMDPPDQVHLRNVVAKVFTPRKTAALEPEIRRLAIEYLDPLIGSSGFDVIAELGAKLPMGVISALLGIPESDRAMVRELSNSSSDLDTDRPECTDRARESFARLSAYFSEQLRERRRSPRDDLMSRMLEVEFRDSAGALRCLNDDEAVVYFNLIAGAGNDKTSKFLGNAVLALAENPDERKRLVDDPALSANAVEEVLRYDGVAHYEYRYVTRDVEWYGEKVREGSWVVLVLGAAGRDEREYPDPDRLDLGRRIERKLYFGRGTHVCLGAHLARLEGRIMLEELHARFPEYEVVHEGVVRAHITNVRGVRELPIRIT